MTDNINSQPFETPSEKKARRREANRIRVKDWRRKQALSLRPTASIIDETLVRCLLDLVTLPPSLRAERQRVIGSVVSQAVDALRRQGYPDVGAAVAERGRDLATKTGSGPLGMHHRLHGAFDRPSKSTPADTPVTLNDRGPYHAGGIADP